MYQAFSPLRISEGVWPPYETYLYVMLLGIIIGTTLPA
jgi:hypothetical protein